MIGRHRGFTLLEVLVALVIVTIGMAAVLSTLASAANTTVYLRDRTLANWVALNRIAELRLAVQQPRPGNSESDVEFAGRKWHYRQDVNQTQVPGMVRIDIKVRPGEGSSGGDSGWFATVSGISGDAVAAPRGDGPLWGSGMLMPGAQTLTPQTAPAIPPPGSSLGSDTSNPAPPTDPGDANIPPPGSQPSQP